MSGYVARIVFVYLILTSATLAVAAAEEAYTLAFSTYLGGTDWEHARDVFADSEGNVYVVGGAASPTSP